MLLPTTLDTAHICKYRDAANTWRDTQLGTTSLRRGVHDFELTGPDFHCKKVTHLFPNAQFALQHKHPHFLTPLVGTVLSHGIIYIGLILGSSSYHLLFPLQYKSCCIRRHAGLFSKICLDYKTCHTIYSKTRLKYRTQQPSNVTMTSSLLSSKKKRFKTRVQ